MAIADLPALLEAVRASPLPLAGSWRCRRWTTARTLFRLLAELARRHDVAGLSMGFFRLSDRRDVGATVVRVGSALFEDDDHLRRDIFDFDGVLLESEFEGNSRLAELLTDLAIAQCRGRAALLCRAERPAIHHAIEQRIGCRLPEEFHDRLAAEQSGASRGSWGVVGAVDFVHLCRRLPRAVASSSPDGSGSSRHLGLADSFGDHSKRTQMCARQAAPPLSYARDSARHRPLLDLEDSKLVRSGRWRPGDGDRSNCRVALPGMCHAEMMRALGVQHVADSFDAVRRLVRLD